jgi:molybdopterin-guanine dinucleotide biosynthesis protein A
MGQDKGLLEYHGVPQIRRLWRQLEALCGRCYVSLSAEQAASEGYAGMPTLIDSVPAVGPATGLLTAWQMAPETAWLVAAVDLPFLDRSTLEALLAGRRADCLATAFEHPDGTLEPLCTIWEPAARPALVARVEAGDASLRGLLEAGPTARLEPPSPEAIISVNSPAERLRALERLGRPG